MASSAARQRLGQIATHFVLPAAGSSCGDGSAEDDDDDAAAAALALAAQISFEEEFQEGDWRVRRAQLLAGDDVRWEEQLARNTNAALKNVATWCHPLADPEPGAVLLADPKMGHFQQHYFAQCVILLLEHGEQ